MSSNFRVMALVPGGRSCLLALGETQTEALELARESALELEAALNEERRRILGAQLEIWVEREGRNAFWKRARSVSLFRELGIEQKGKVAVDVH